MANPNFDALASTTLKNYQKKFADNVSNHIPTMKYMMLKGANKLSGGQSIVRPIISAFNTTANSYSRMETLDTTEQEGITSAEYNWKQCSVQVTLHGLERSQNQGEAAFLSLMDGKVKQAELSLENKISVMLFGDGTGNSGKDLLGFEALIAQDPTTGTVGGINRATDTYWRNKVNTSVGSFASGGLTAMGTLKRQLTRGTSKPNLIITTATIFGYLQTVANGRAQFMNPALGELGFEALKFEGIDVIYDENCTADRMYFINTDHLRLDIHKDVNFDMGKFIEPANQDGSVAKIRFYGQLTSDRLESCGVLSGFSA